MRIGKFILTLAFSLFLLSVQSQTSFIPGNIVVYRVGAGVTNLGSAAVPVYLDEYTPAGVLVRTIDLPVAASGSNNVLTAAGNGSTEGTISLSSDGQYIVFTGYAVAVGTSSIGGSSSFTRPRTIGTVRYDGLVNTSTAVLDLSSGGPIRSATSTNGTDLWACGAGSSSGTGGIRYLTLGSFFSGQINAAGGPSQLRSVCIAKGQLFVTGNGGSPRIGTVGTGLPTTTGQVVTNLPGLPVNVDPGQIALLDMNAGVSGIDVLYYTDEAVGIVKYSLVSGSWVSNGVVGDNTDDYRGLAAKVSGSTVTLFATRRGGNGASIEGGQLVRITDASGYNGSFSATPTVLANSVTDKTAFRGISVVPVQSGLPIKLVSFTAEKNNNDVKLNWVAESAVNFSHFEVERSVDGFTFTNISTIPLTVNGNFQEQYNYTDGAILNDPTLQYALFYRLKMLDADGHTEYSKIVTIPLREKTARSITVYPDPFISQIFVNGLQPGPINVSLLDMQGRIVKQIKLNLGTNQQNISLSGLDELQKGTYLLRIRQNNKSTTFKMVK